jgi:hypothetical protein
MEFDSRYSHASSIEEDQIDEGETDEDNIIDSGMPQERESPLRHTRRRLADVIETIKRETGAMKQQVEVLGNKELVDKVTEMRDELISGAERRAAIRERAAIVEKARNEVDMLRRERETRWAQIEGSGKLAYLLNTPLLICDYIPEERDLLTNAEIEAADADEIKKVIDNLKRETQDLLEAHMACASWKTNQTLQETEMTTSQNRATLSSCNPCH